MDTDQLGKKVIALAKELEAAEPVSKQTRHVCAILWALSAVIYAGPQWLSLMSFQILQLNERLRSVYKSQAAAVKQSERFAPNAKQN